VGLDLVDAHRSAFVAFACSQGWTKARIGRYLGISRARVGQKVDKLEHYASETTGVPTLKAVMRKCETVKSTRRESDDLVVYTFDDWRDVEFARRLVESVAS
jgi:hypothetical protein